MQLSRLLGTRQTVYCKSLLNLFSPGLVFSDLVQFRFPFHLFPNLVLVIRFFPELNHNCIILSKLQSNVRKFFGSTLEYSSNDTIATKSPFYLFYLASGYPHPLLKGRFVTFTSFYTYKFLNKKRLIKKRNCYLLVAESHSNTIVKLNCNRITLYY